MLAHRKCNLAPLAGLLILLSASHLAHARNTTTVKRRVGHVAVGPVWGYRLEVDTYRITSEWDQTWENEAAQDARARGVNESLAASLLEPDNHDALSLAPEQSLRVNTTALLLSEVSRLRRQGEHKDEAIAAAAAHQRSLTVEKDGIIAGHVTVIAQQHDKILMKNRVIEEQAGLLAGAHQTTLDLRSGLANVKNELRAARQDLATQHKAIVEGDRALADTQTELSSTYIKLKSAERRIKILQLCLVFAVTTLCILGLCLRLAWTSDKRTAEKIVERQVIQKVPVEVIKEVEKIVELKTFVDREVVKDRLVPFEVIKEVKKFVYRDRPVEHIRTVYVDRPVIKEKIVEKIVKVIQEVPVLQPPITLVQFKTVIREVPVEVVKEVFVDRVVQTEVEESTLPAPASEVGAEDVALPSSQPAVIPDSEPETQTQSTASPAPESQPGAEGVKLSSSEPIAIPEVGLNAEGKTSTLPAPQQQPAAEDVAVSSHPSTAVSEIELKTQSESTTSPAPEPQLGAEDVPPSSDEPAAMPEVESRTEGKDSPLPAPEPELGAEDVALSTSQPTVVPDNSLKTQIESTTPSAPCPQLEAEDVARLSFREPVTLPDKASDVQDGLSTLPAPEPQLGAEDVALLSSSGMAALHNCVPKAQVSDPAPFTLQPVGLPDIKQHVDGQVPNASIGSAALPVIAIHVESGEAATVPETSGSKRTRGSPGQGDVRKANRQAKRDQHRAKKRAEKNEEWKAGKKAARAAKKAAVAAETPKTPLRT